MVSHSVTNATLHAKHNSRPICRFSAQLRSHIIRNHHLLVLAMGLEPPPTPPRDSVVRLRETSSSETRFTAAAKKE